MRFNNLSYLTLALLLLVTLVSGRALDYDQLDRDDATKSSSSEIEDQEEIQSKLSQLLNNKDYDDMSADSYEERQYHERSLLSSSRAPHAISSQTRQAIIDMLQKAFDQGWRPNLKHYIPATRFGRHRR